MANSSSSSRLTTLSIPSEYFWLSPTFDPSMTLAVELRRMLQAHNVPIRNASTKTELVRLFKHHVQDNRPALLASITPSPTSTPQPKPKRPKSGHRKQPRTVAPPAAESTGPSDESGEEESGDDDGDEDGDDDGDDGDDHDDHDADDDDDNDNERNGNEANAPGGANPPPPSFHPRRATTAQNRSTNGAHHAQDRGLKKKISQLEADIEGLRVSMGAEREQLQRMGDAMATVMGGYDNTRKQIRKIHRKVKALN